MALKLPVLRTTKGAYNHLVENAGAFASAAGPWCALLLLVKLGLAWVTDASLLPQILGFLLDMTLSAAALSAFAVAWHRHILVADQTLGTTISGELIFRYFLRALAVVGGLYFAILFGSVMGGIFIASTPGALAPAEAVLVAGGLCALLLLGRLCLVFPATAIGEKRMTLSMSWKFTAHNTWRILAVMLLTTVPAFVLLYAALTALLNGQGPSTIYQIVAVMAFGTIFLFLLVALTAGASSFTYQSLVWDRQSGLPSGSPNPAGV